MSLSSLVLPVALPLAAGVVALLVPRALRGVREALAILVTAAVASLAALDFIRGGEAFRFPLVEIGGFSLSIDFAPTPIGSFMLLAGAGFGFLVCLYSLAAMAGRPRLREYYAFLLFAVGGSCGVFLADHLLAFLIFWEIVTASLYFLLTTGGPEARGGATKTFVMLGAADGALLLGIGLLWFSTGSFSLGAASVPAQGWLNGTSFALVMLAAVTKAGSMPFHTWIPAASEGAPASVMAFLPAALDKLLGIYLLARVVLGLFVVGPAWGIALMAIGAVTVVAAVMMAMVQHDLRRLLSYHAVSQVGYMVLGIGTLTPIGIAGGLFHMLNNAIYKGCLFLCAGSVEKKVGSMELDELGGLAGAMPATFSSFLVAALAISGIPPLNGFVSKWMIYQGALEAGGWQSYLFLVAAMFGSALTLASFVKALYAAFLGQRSARTAAVRGDVNAAMFVPALVLAALCILFGVFYPRVLELLITPGAGRDPGLSSPWDAGLATVFILVGIALGAIVYLVGWMRKKARVAEPFVGGESMAPHELRVSAARFYDTIRTLPVLRSLYRGQERGWFDAHLLLGKAGAAVTWLLRRAHTGILPWYLSWSLIGALVLFAVLRWAR